MKKVKNWKHFLDALSNQGVNQILFLFIYLYLYTYIYIYTYAPSLALSLLGETLFLHCNFILVRVVFWNSCEGVSKKMASFLGLATSWTCLVLLLAAARGRRFWQNRVSISPLGDSGRTTWRWSSWPSASWPSLTWNWDLSGSFLKRFWSSSSFSLAQERVFFI